MVAGRIGVEMKRLPDPALRDLVECAAETMEILIKTEDDMKIAVASEKDMVTEHFGHCENFNIFTVEKDKITNRESIPNPGHQPGFLPNFLNDMGVRVIISGGMGGGAVQIFEEKGIEVFTGVRGNAAGAVENYISGSLKSTGSVCHEHAHHDECGQ